MPHLMKRLGAFGGALMLMLTVVPVLTVSGAEIDTAEDDLSEIERNLNDLRNDIDNIETNSDFDGWAVNIKGELSSTERVVDRIDVDIGASAHARLTAAVDDVTDEADGLVVEADTALDASFNAKLDDVRDSIDASQARLERMLDDFNVIDDDDGNTADTDENEQKAVRAAIRIDALIEGDVAELEDETDVESSSARFDLWADALIDLLDEVEANVLAIQETSVNGAVSVQNAISRLRARVEDALDALEANIGPSLQDEFDKLKVSIIAQLNRIETAVNALGVPVSPAVPIACFNTGSIVSGLNRTISAVKTLAEEAKTVDSTSEFDVAAKKTIELATEVNTNLNLLHGHRVVVLDVTSINTLRADARARLNTVVDVLRDKDSVRRADLSKLERDLKEIFDSNDTAFAAFISENATCTNTEPRSERIQRFPDVPVDNEFWRYIDALAAADILHGYADGFFRPKTHITRAEYLKLALRAAGVSTALFAGQADVFTDVKADHSLGAYIRYAVAGNILKPVSRNRFAPDVPITRADAMMVVMKAFNRAPDASLPNPFTDVTNEEETLYIKTAAHFNIISGYAPGLFGPRLAITRDEATKMIGRALESFVVF